MVKTISLNGLTIEEASSYLIKNGFTVGSNKPSDYACRGLILQGMRNVDNGGTNSYKFYYNPIVLPEFMTASILKKGRWLDIGSQQNYTKLTDLDVYAGSQGQYKGLGRTGLCRFVLRCLFGWRTQAFLESDERASV